MKKILIILFITCFTLTGCINQKDEQKQNETTTKIQNTQESRIVRAKKSAFNTYAIASILGAQLQFQTDILLDNVDLDNDTYKCYTLEDLNRTFRSYEGIVEISISNRVDYEYKISITDNEYHLKEAIYKEDEGFREKIINGKAPEKFSCNN